MTVIRLTAQVSPLTAQVDRERAEFAAWLASAPNSPYALIAQQPIGAGLTLGAAAADIPLDGVPRLSVSEAHGSVTLVRDAERRALPRYRLTPYAGYTFYLSGTPGRSLLAVYGAARHAKPPTYYPLAPAWNFVVALVPPTGARSKRLLALDGVEVEATDAGRVQLPLGAASLRLQVFRLPDPATDESDLTIYFQDSTSGHGSYPAGRFVTLTEAGAGRYRLDFNRARNPFCAYSTAYACPAPWPGNTIPAGVEAGERYEAAEPTRKPAAP